MLHSISFNRAALVLGLSAALLLVIGSPAKAQRSLSGLVIHEAGQHKPLVVVYRDGSMALRYEARVSGGMVDSSVTILTYGPDSPRRAISKRVLTQLSHPAAGKGLRESMGPRVEMSASEAADALEGHGIRSLDEVGYLASLYSGLANALFDDLDRDRWRNHRFYDVIYHVSIIKSAFRYLESAIRGEELARACTVSAKYLSDGFAFLCEEDILIDAELLFQSLSASTNRSIIGGYRLSEFPWQPGDRVSAADVKHWVAQQEGDLPSEKLLICLLLDGSDCGCCGNYDGSCLACSPTCYLHDLACEDCEIWGQGWACGPACQEGSC